MFSFLCTRLPIQPACLPACIYMPVVVFHCCVHCVLLPHVCTGTQSRHTSHLRRRRRHHKQHHHPGGAEAPRPEEVPGSFVTKSPPGLSVSHPKCGPFLLGIIGGEGAWGWGVGGRHPLVLGAPVYQNSIHGAASRSLAPSLGYCPGGDFIVSPETMLK